MIRLKKAITIPAGTILKTAPTQRAYGEGSYECNLSLTKDSTSIFTFFVDELDDKLNQYFEEVEDE